MYIIKKSKGLYAKRRVSLPTPGSHHGLVSMLVPFPILLHSLQDALIYPCHEPRGCPFGLLHPSCSWQYISCFHGLINSTFNLDTQWFKVLLNGQGSLMTSHKKRFPLGLKLCSVSALYISSSCQFYTGLLCNTEWIWEGVKFLLRIFLMSFITFMYARPIGFLMSFFCLKITFFMQDCSFICYIINLNI